jgi:hypothetical protein
VKELLGDNRELAVESLKSVSGFPGAGHKPCRRPPPLWEISGFDDFPYDVETNVPCASSYDSRSELFQACRWEVREGVYDRDDQVARMLPAMFHCMKEAKEGSVPRALGPRMTFGRWRLSWTMRLPNESGSSGLTTNGRP